LSDPNEWPAKAAGEPTSNSHLDAAVSPAAGIATARGAAGAAGNEMAEAERLAFRIEAAVLVDHVLRLRAEAEGHSAWSRIVRACATALRSIAGHSRRTGARSEDTERYAKVLLKSGLFDAEYYLRRNPDVAAAGVDPVLHYLQYGAREMRDPGPRFSTRAYIQRYPRAAECGLNPLYHYIVRGYAEGLQATPGNAVASVVGLRRGSVLPAAETALPAIGRNRRLVVYSALFGDYDDLFVPAPQQAESCDFVLFTDKPEIPAPWRRGAVCYAAADRFKQNRFYKLLPHRLFPDYEWSLYLDGNIDFRIDPIEFLDRQRRVGSDFYVFRHPRRTNILEELAACIEMKKDDAELMVRQVAEYYERGFRHSFALTENNVILRRHNDPAIVALGEAWWEEVRSKSRRDQLSLAYAVEKTAYRGIALFDEGRATARHYPGLNLRPHRRQDYARGSLDGSRL